MQCVSCFFLQKNVTEFYPVLFDRIIFNLLNKSTSLLYSNKVNTKPHNKYFLMPSALTSLVNMFALEKLDSKD